MYPDEGAGFRSARFAAAGREPGFYEGIRHHARSTGFRDSCSDELWFVRGLCLDVRTQCWLRKCMWLRGFVL